MPHARIATEPTRARILLHLGSSPADAWEAVIAPWFESVANKALTEQRPIAVVTPHSALAYFFRSELLNRGISLLGVKFLLPPHLREMLVAPRGLRVPLREHLRLLLGAAADDFVREHAGDDESPGVLVARSVARDPDSFLRALDQLSAAGADLRELESETLREIAARFEKSTRDLGFTFGHEADRAIAKEPEPVFANLLIAGFDSAHSSLWPLLRGAALSASEATIVLNDPRDEARDIDETWVATWEETFGAGQPIPATDTRSTSSFAELLAQPARGTKRKAPRPNDNMHFVMARDTTEQARAIAALTVAFLSERACERVGILLPGPSALARLVAAQLEQLDIPHNDNIAHPLRGVFDDEEWRAWIQLQRQPRLGALLRFLKQSNAALKWFEPLPLRTIEDKLKRACGDILINAVDVLQKYCARRTDDAIHTDIAAGLGKIEFLPERAPFADLLKETLSILRALEWSERAAELERLSRDWAENFTAKISRENFLRWLNDLFAESSLERDEQGDNPYARVQLLRYDQAENQNWSHVIFAGLNEGVWPPRDDEAPFLPDEAIDALNKRNKSASRFGEGPSVMRDGSALCLGARERRAMSLRELLNTIECTTRSIGVTAELYTHTPREQTINPSEFYAQLFFRARGEALSQTQIAQLHTQTQRWLAQQEFLRPCEREDVDLAQTSRAYSIRRGDAPFGEYEFAFRGNAPPQKQAEMSATDLANALQRPALVWMKTFLGVQAEELLGGSWNLATGQWVHRWLARIGADSRENRFVPRLPNEQMLERVLSAADHFRERILSILRECGRPLPDWWTSGWQNARHLAEKFAREIAKIDNYSLLATEWELDSPHIIALTNGNELRVRGRVDLILADAAKPTRWWIVDYKTGEARPLKAADLQKQLGRGDGIQICIYLLALRERAPEMFASLLPRSSELAPQVSGDDVGAQSEIWNELARMQRTGVFGMLGELRSEFKFTGTYPLATIAIERELLQQKWERTHPAFARPRK